MRKEFNPNAAVESTAMGSNPTNLLYLNMAYSDDTGTVVAAGNFVVTQTVTYYIRMIDAKDSVIV